MCGLIGVTGTSDAAQEVLLGLMNLQHRGQDGAGILTVADSDSSQFNLQKGSGLIENVFSERSFKVLRGKTSIGHTRYATIGKKDPNLLQPFLDYQAGVGLGHNGNIVNCYQLSKELKDQMPKPLTDSDSEVILRLLTGYLGEGNWTTEDFFRAVKNVMGRIVGSYAIVGLDRNGGLFGFRDPNGIRPLVLGRKRTVDGNACYALASETVALTYLGYTDLEEIKPGECIYIDAQQRVRKEILKQSSYSPCMFEWVYFARVESEIGDVSVYEARFQLGLHLADHLKRLNIQADVVLPVPETSRAAAIAIAESMDIPYRELLIKNRYVNRTFILDDQVARQQAINRKLFPIAKEIKGKRCLIVDDSIVRGNTAAKIVQMVRHSGAKEIIVVSTCPPIRHPCFYGIDFPSGAELIAANANEEEVAKELGCDRVVYQTLTGLKEALAQRSLCTGCLSDEYPTDLSSRNEFETQRLKDRSDAIIEKVI